MDQVQAGAGNVLHVHPAKDLIGFADAPGAPGPLWDISALSRVAMARCALRSPQRLDDARLRVVLASDDGFVPRPATESLYEAVAVVPDDHPLCGRAARDAIAGASAELLSEPLLGAPT